MTVGFVGRANNWAHRIRRVHAAPPSMVRQPPSAYTELIRVLARSLDSQVTGRDVQPPVTKSDVNDAIQRRTVHYRGRVQGVGFRFTVQAIAARHDVRGFVRNLSDGRVVLMAEGTAAALDDFLSAVDDEMQRYIAGRDTSIEAATGEFSDFVIRR